MRENSYLHEALPESADLDRDCTNSQRELSRQWDSHPQRRCSRTGE